MRGVVTIMPDLSTYYAVGCYNSPTSTPVSTASGFTRPGARMGSYLQRFPALFILLALAVSAFGGGTAVLPLAPGEWLSVGLAVWLGPALGAAGCGGGGT